MPSLVSNKSITSNSRSDNSRRSSVSSNGSSVWSVKTVPVNNLGRNQYLLELASLYKKYKRQYAALSVAHESSNETLNALHAAVEGTNVRNYRAEMANVQAKITALLEQLRITPEQLEANYLRLTTNLSPFEIRARRTTRKGSVSGGKRKSRRTKKSRK
jgi:hypothetical protein